VTAPEDAWPYRRGEARELAHDFASFEARGQRSPMSVQDAPVLFLAGVSVDDTDKPLPTLL
jgi:hypothetical protein